MPAIAIRLHRRFDFSWRPRRALPPELPAGEAHGGPFARHAGGDRRSDLPASGVGARNAYRFRFYLLLNAEVRNGDLAARSLQLDLSPSQYGAETAPLRSALRNTLVGIDAVIWGDGRSDPQQFKAAEVLPSLRGMVARFSALSPTSDSQKQLLGAIGADEAQIQQTRLLMSLQLASPISWPLLIVVASWSILLFCGFGILSRLNITTLAALALGSFAIGSAIFLILELNEPYSGLFKVPRGAMQQAIEALG
jgi:hypothetical protein